MMEPRQQEKLFDLEDASLYVNRELSLLEFQCRVFDEAKDVRNPLLERAKFLAILGNNMDEFFMVRVGGLRMQLDAGVAELSQDGKTPAEQLAEIRNRLHRNRLAEPLFDSKKYTRDFESGLRRVYNLYLYGRSPQDIWV